MKKLKRFDSVYGRAYVLEEENVLDFFPSVTTILSLFQSTELHQIQEALGEETFALISDKAAKKGTAMHKFLENFVLCMKHTNDLEKCLFYTQRKTTNDLLDKLEKSYVDAGRSLFYNIYYENLFSDIKKVLLSEAFLFSKKHKFAGAVDLVFQDLKNLIVITDFKSASSPREGEVIHKYELQGSAYVIGFEELSGKKTDRVELWISSPDAVQRHILGGKLLEERKEEFCTYAYTYNNMWQKDLIKNLYLTTK